MNDDEAKKDDPANRFNEDEEVDQAIRKGVRIAVETHRKRGEPVVVWRDGKPVWVDPEEMLEAKPEPDKG